MAEAAESGLTRFPNDPGLATSLCRSRAERGDWSQRKSDIRRFRRTLELPRTTKDFHAGTAASLAQIVRFPPSIILGFARRMAAQSMAMIGGMEASQQAATKWLPSRGSQGTPRDRIMAKHKAGSALLLGLVSSDWHQSHPVPQCVRGLLAHLSRARFEPLAYSTHTHTNAEAGGGYITSETGVRLRSLDTLSSQQASSLVQQDGVSILVHINGYTKWERTDIFAMHPAPIQISAIGYELTLAIDAVPYILTDLASLPPSDTRDGYLEKSVAMPHAYLPNDYKARPSRVLETYGEPNVGHPGYLLFASNNHNGKLDPRTFAVWCNLLRRTEGAARLRLRPVHHQYWNGAQTAAGDDPRRWPGTIGDELAQHGLPKSSLLFLPRVDRMEDYFVKIAEADLALDTIAYGGQTTTLDTMAVAVPALSLPGVGVVARFTYAAMVPAWDGLGGLGYQVGVALSAKQYEDACHTLGRG